MRVATKFIKDAGQPNGIATLDGSGKVPTSQLPAGSSIAKSQTDTSWDGSTTTKNVTVSSDARGYLWQLLDNTNGYERIFCTIKATTSTNVQIVTSPALPAGTYRLVGVG